MKIPWVLRLETAWAALRGQAESISFMGDTYRVELRAGSVQRWLRRRKTMKGRAR